MDLTKFRITPDDIPNKGIMFADLDKDGCSGHLGHALVEYAPGKLLAFYPRCSALDKRWAGHSGHGYMEYKRSEDGGESWSEPIAEPNSKALFESDPEYTFMCEKAVCTDSGRIVLFYLACDMTVDGHIWEPYREPRFAVSDDCGESFSEAKLFSSDKGRIYDALYHDRRIYVLFYANPELPGIARTTEYEMRLYVSDDNGESFTLLSVVPFESMINCFYGNMVFREDSSLIVYTYDEKDEHNLKYIVSRDGGKTWGNNRRAYFEKKLRNPQLIRFKDTYFIHGRSGLKGKDAGHFVLYSSPDAENWDDGTYLCLKEAGHGAYSNNLVVHLPAGRERMMIQVSHAYSANCTNVVMFFLDAIE